MLAAVFVFTGVLNDVYWLDEVRVWTVLEWQADNQGVI